MGKVFGKAFRTLVLDERKGRWVVKQDCHRYLLVNVTWFFAVSGGSPLLNCALCDMVRKISSPCTS